MFDTLKPGKDFLPVVCAIALVTNLEYDPKGFSEEIETSEKGQIGTLKRIEPERNSEKWKEYRTRGFALTVYRKVVKQGYTGFWVR